VNDDRRSGEETCDRDLLTPGETIMDENGSEEAENPEDRSPEENNHR
jgi:hypothetical protein